MNLNKQWLLFFIFVTCARASRPARAAEPRRAMLSTSSEKSSRRKALPFWAAPRTAPSSTPSFTRSKAFSTHCCAIPRALSMRSSKCQGGLRSWWKTELWSTPCRRSTLAQAPQTFSKCFKLRETTKDADLRWADRAFVARTRWNLEVKKKLKSDGIWWLNDGRFLCITSVGSHLGHPKVWPDLPLVLKMIYLSVLL